MSAYPEILWRAVVGSHMWRMNRPDSDTDYYTAYAVDPRLFFVGDQEYKGQVPPAPRADAEDPSFEVRSVVHQLLKGNLNHLWGVLSPIQVIDGPERQALAALVRAHPAKGVYHSTRGMIAHNVSHLAKQAPERQRKTRLSIARCAALAISILRGEGPAFEPVAEPPADDEIARIDATLTAAYEASALPESPPREPFADFLTNLYLSRV